MNDLETMLDIFRRAKEKGIVNFSVSGEIDGSKTHIYLYRHKFTFNTKGELINSNATDLNELN